jgi:hypothetical protein
MPSPEAIESPMTTIDSGDRAPAIDEFEPPPRHALTSKAVIISTNVVFAVCILVPGGLRVLQVITPSIFSRGTLARSATPREHQDTRRQAAQSSECE